MAFEIVRYAGVAYLLWLGVRALRTRERGPETVERPPASMRRAFAEGMVVNLLNPKVTMFFLAFLPQFVDPERGAAWTQVLALGAVFMTLACLLDAVYVLAAGALGGRLRGRTRHQPGRGRGLPRAGRPRRRERRRPARMSPTLRGALLATIALALVGSLVASADLVEGYPLPAGQALRYSLAALVLAAFARFSLPRLTLRETVGIAAVSATGLVLFNLFVIEGVRETDPATVGVIIGCVPVLLALLGPLLEGRPLSARLIAAAAIVSLRRRGRAVGGRWHDRGRPGLRARRARLRGGLLAARAALPGAAGAARPLHLRLPVRGPHARRLEPDRRRPRAAAARAPSRPGRWPTWRWA